VTNYQGTHDLPGIVLAHVLGYRTGSDSFELDLPLFDRAIAELEPAGACDAYDHPNLWAWQNLRTEIVEGRFAVGYAVVVVFIGDVNDPSDEDPILQLRHELGVDP